MSKLNQGIESYASKERREYQGHYHRVFEQGGGADELLAEAPDADAVVLASETAEGPPDEDGHEQCQAGRR